jgi:hypothetical protein
MTSNSSLLGLLSVLHREKHGLGTTVILHERSQGISTRNGMMENRQRDRFMAAPSG